MAQIVHCATTIAAERTLARYLSKRKTRLMAILRKQSFTRDSLLNTQSTFHYKLLRLKKLRSENDMSMVLMVPSPTTALAVTTQPALT